MLGNFVPYTQHGCCKHTLHGFGYIYNPHENKYKPKQGGWSGSQSFNPRTYWHWWLPVNKYHFFFRNVVMNTDNILRHNKDIQEAQSQCHAIWRETQRIFIKIRKRIRIFTLLPPFQYCIRSLRALRRLKDKKVLQIGKAEVKVSTFE